MSLQSRTFRSPGDGSLGASWAAGKTGGGLSAAQRSNPLLAALAIELRSLPPLGEQVAGRVQKGWGMVSQ